MSILTKNVSTASFAIIWQKRKENYFFLFLFLCCYVAIASLTHWLCIELRCERSPSYTSSANMWTHPLSPPLVEVVVVVVVVAAIVVASWHDDGWCITGRRRWLNGISEQERRNPARGSVERVVLSLSAFVSYFIALLLSLSVSLPSRKGWITLSAVCEPSSAIHFPLASLPLAPASACIYRRSATVVVVVQQYARRI